MIFSQIVHCAPSVVLFLLQPAILCTALLFCLYAGSCGCSSIGGRTEWIKLQGSVPGLYLCASLPATYPGGLSSKKISPSKEWIFFGGWIKWGQCIKNIQNKRSNFIHSVVGVEKERKDRTSLAGRSLDFRSLDFPSSMDVMITENQKIVGETCQRNVKASVTAGFQLLQQLEALLVSTFQLWIILSGTLCFDMRSLKNSGGASYSSRFML